MRFTNKTVVCQVAYATMAGDKVICAAYRWVCGGGACVGGGEGCWIWMGVPGKETHVAAGCTSCGCGFCSSTCGTPAGGSKQRGWLLSAEPQMEQHARLCSQTDCGITTAAVGTRQAGRQQGFLH